MFPVINIFGKTIGSYALCSFIGLFVAVFAVWRLSKSIKLQFEDIILMVLVVSAGILAGGSALYGITNINKIFYYIGEIAQKFKSDALSFDLIKRFVVQCFGGMVFYGGFIGATVALLIYLKITKINHKKEILDIFAVSIPLFHTFGRLGCFFGGCCYGIESSFGLIANNSLLPEMSGVRRFPVALLESLLNFLIFLFLLYLFKRGVKRGKLLFMYMIIYPAIRFNIEFLRGDQIRGIFLHLSTSQWISILLFAIGIIFIKNRKIVDKDWDGYKE